jgi:PAS domain S-box-containing protein
MRAISFDPQPQSTPCVGSVRGAGVVPVVVLSTGALVALVGAVHLVAWLAGAMAQRGAAAITMKTNTALCLLLLGTSLCLLVPRDIPAARHVGRGCAAFASLTGILTLSENLFGWDLRIDQLLAHESSGALGMVHPNRIGTPASIGIALIGLALLLTSLRGARWLVVAQVIALCVSLIGLLPTVGYVYGAQWLYGVARVTAIAWPTAVSLLLLGLGVLCARASEGLMTRVTAADSGGAVIRRLLPVLLVPLGLGWLRLLGERSRLFDAAMGTTLMMVLFIVVFGSATYLAGRHVGRSSAELQRERETLAVTLASIGDAVLACDTSGRITYVNPVATSLTGWSSEAALTQRVETVFQIINEKTRAPAANIVAQVLQDKRVLALSNHTALISKDGNETPIEDSAAPIVDSQGTVCGVVLVFHEVAEKRRAQEALRESEQRFRLKLESILSPQGDIGSLELADLIDADALRSQLESFYQISGIPVGIIDMKGKVLVGVGWQEVCTKFHRVNPESCRHCIESDTQLSVGVPEGEHKLYKCKNNMWDVATPITVGGRHMGNIFTGQFFFDDEVVDRDVFRAQAKRFGFCEEEYLAAIDRVPRLTRSAVKVGMAFYAKLSHMLSKLSYSNLALARALAERDRADSVSRSTLERFYAVLSSMYSAVLLVTKEGRVEFANPAFCDRFGLKHTPAELAGLSAGELLERINQAYLHPDQALARIKEIVATGQPVHGEELAMRDGGTCLRDFVPLNVQGESYGRLWLHSDITGIKRTEEALRQANAQLAAADVRKNEFLAVLSHELRNPLAPITNSLYILGRAPPGGEQASRAKEVIARQVTQLSHLVDDLLDVTRITSNKIHLDKERLELNEVVRRAIEDNRSLFDKAEVRLDLSPAPDPAFVYADRIRVAQIIGNLLQNAAKFTRKGGVTRVSLQAEGNEAKVRVADDGVGMSPEILGRLFQPFMQADQTLDRSKGGLGLGLALVKGLVELHGGGIFARSEGLGKGCEFLMCLPLDTGVTLAAAAQSLPAARAPRRILIIEDNVDAADSLRDALEFGGNEVQVAGDGPDGLAKARTCVPDVILCDIGLPGMDGYEVARMLRSDAAFQNTRLVALSGYALPEDLQRASEAGFEQHLAKPPSIELLEELLGNLPDANGAVSGAEVASESSK